MAPHAHERRLPGRQRAQSGTQCALGWRLSLGQYVFTALGLIILWRASRRSHERWSWKLLPATMLIGFGAFNLVEGLIDHQLLGIHHVNETVPREQWIYWDISFLIWGAAMLLGGWLLCKNRAKGYRCLDFGLIGRTASMRMSVSVNQTNGSDPDSSHSATISRLGSYILSMSANRFTIDWQWALNRPTLHPQLSGLVSARRVVRNDHRVLLIGATSRSVSRRIVQRSII